jgi:ferredoxin-NADP reductase
MSNETAATTAAFEARLRAVEPIAEGTIAMRFTKPEGFDHTAGQHTVIHLGGDVGLEGEDREHMFTIASAPHEQELLFATRIKDRDSVWKGAVQRLAPGTRVELDAPDGEFVFDDTGQPAVFLTGGIGVTPFRSMLMDLEHRGERRDVTMLYSNKSPEEAAFLEELEALEFPGFRFVPTMTQAPDAWQGERRRIDADMLREHVPNLRESRAYIAGPPGMVRDLRRFLLAEGLDRKAIRTEEFTGY